jgi:prophage regulatory protein
VLIRANSGAIVDIPDASIYRFPAVKRRTGPGGTSIYKAINDGTFPKPVRLIGRSVGWISHEVDAWIAERERVETFCNPGATPQPKRRTARPR